MPMAHTNTPDQLYDMAATVACLRQDSAKQRRMRGAFVRDGASTARAARPRTTLPRLHMPSTARTLHANEAPAAAAHDPKAWGSRVSSIKAMIAPKATPCPVHHNSRAHAITPVSSRVAAKCRGPSQRTKHPPDHSAPYRVTSVKVSSREGRFDCL